ncbi:hypothetical protein JCM1393_11400 [Clostridium carnis]
MKDEILELYNILVENGVIFYYGSESIATGEITNLNINDNGTVIIEINSFENYEIDIEDFIENHSKEGVNYHSWQYVRAFDNKLIEI